MRRQSKAMLKELLNLPATDRHMIAEQLYFSLSDEEQDDLLEKELDTRWKEVVSGKVKLIPRSALKQKHTRS